MIGQSEVWWAELDEPVGSAPRYRRPVVLSADTTGLAKDSVANVSRVVALDKQGLTERVGRIPGRQLDLIPSGIDVVLGR